MSIEQSEDLDFREGLSNRQLSYEEPRWYVLHTCANHEKRVAQQLAERNVEQFLPLFESLRRWKDRRVRLQLPLFNGYVFARLALRNRLQVLGLPSVVRLVGFGGVAAPLADREIETLRQALAPQLRAAPHPYLTSGKRVRVLDGPLKGAEGTLVRRKSGCRVVLAMDLIARAASVEIDANDVELIS
ncbi:MAG: transcription termination/antitermination protein NusG [Candidatus Acidiferrales bacterium]